MPQGLLQQGMSTQVWGQSPQFAALNAQLPEGRLDQVPQEQ